MLFIASTWVFGYVLFLAEYSTEKRGSQKCAVWLGLCHLQRALENKTRIFDWMPYLVAKIVRLQYWK